MDKFYFRHIARSNACQCIICRRYAHKGTTGWDCGSAMSLSRSRSCKCGSTIADYIDEGEYFTHNQVCVCMLLKYVDLCLKIFVHSFSDIGFVHLVNLRIDNFPFHFSSYMSGQSVCEPTEELFGIDFFVCAIRIVLLLQFLAGLLIQTTINP